MDAVDQERVVLVDGSDREIGSQEKLRAHLEGTLHRAVSVFLFDGEGSLLLQRRAPGKYHSGGLWANTCCSHPMQGEAPLVAAQRRLREEMGLEGDLASVCQLEYRTDVGQGLVEHEYVHVFTGQLMGEPSPDPREVAEWRLAGIAELQAELQADPSAFAPWFPILLERVLSESQGR